MNQQQQRGGRMRATDPEAEMRELLRSYQVRRKLTDRQMGELCGIPHTSWNLFKRGKRPFPRPKILGAFVRVHPRRMGLLREFLLGRDNAA
jgi:hypothetical protein